MTTDRARHANIESDRGKISHLSLCHNIRYALLGECTVCCSAARSVHVRGHKNIRPVEWTNGKSNNALRNRAPSTRRLLCGWCYPILLWFFLTTAAAAPALYRDLLKGLYVVAINFFLLLLNCFAWPCLANALQIQHTFWPRSTQKIKKNFTTIYH